MPALPPEQPHLPAPKTTAWGLVLGLVLSTLACQPGKGPAAAPAGGHTVRLAVASESGVPEALPRLLLACLQQELARAGLYAAAVDEPGSAGTLAILVQPVLAPAPSPLPTDAGRPQPSPLPPPLPPGKSPRSKASDPRPAHPSLRLQLRSPGRSEDTPWARRIGRCCSARAFAAVRQEARRRLALFSGRAPLPSPPLWRGTAAHEDFLNDSLLAGLRWLLNDALDPHSPALSDPLQVFLILSQAAKDPALRRLGREVGPMLARRFLARVPLPRASHDPASLTDLAAGLHFAQAFGVPVPERLRRALVSAIRGAGPRLLHREHPRSETRRLLDALVDLYFLHRLGLPSPRPYAEVIAEVRRFPLTVAPGDTARTLEERTYLATHLLYVLSDFSRDRLAEAEVRHVVRFLEHAAPRFLAAQDLETLGEVADSLRIVGRTREDPLLRRIVLRLLTGQSPDGSFGSATDPRPYVRFHTTWTAVNGLLPHRFESQGPRDPVIARAWRSARTTP